MPTGYVFTGSADSSAMPSPLTSPHGGRHFAPSPASYGPTTTMLMRRISLMEEKCTQLQSELQGCESGRLAAIRQNEHMKMVLQKLGLNEDGVPLNRPPSGDCDRTADDIPHPEHISSAPLTSQDRPVHLSCHNHSLSSGYAGSLPFSDPVLSQSSAVAPVPHRPPLVSPEVAVAALGNPLRLPTPQPIRRGSPPITAAVLDWADSEESRLRTEAVALGGRIESAPAVMSSSAVPRHPHTAALLPMHPNTSAARSAAASARPVPSAVFGDFSVPFAGSDSIPTSPATPECDMLPVETAESLAVRAAAGAAFAGAQQLQTPSWSPPEAHSSVLRMPSSTSSSEAAPSMWTGHMSHLLQPHPPRSRAASDMHPPRPTAISTQPYGSATLSTDISPLQFPLFSTAAVAAASPRTDALPTLRKTPTISRANSAQTYATLTAAAPAPPTSARGHLPAIFLSAGASIVSSSSTSAPHSAASTASTASSASPSPQVSPTASSQHPGAASRSRARRETSLTRAEWAATLQEAEAAKKGTKRSAQHA
jgi:hypothetical protein